MSQTTTLKIPMKTKGDLKQHGYALAADDSARQEALRRAIADLGPAHVIKKLNALTILTRTKFPDRAAIFQQDMHYVQSLHPGHEIPAKSSASHNISGVKRKRATSQNHTQLKSTKRKASTKTSKKKNAQSVKSAKSTKPKAKPKAKSTKTTTKPKSKKTTSLKSKAKIRK